MVGDGCSAAIVEDRDGGDGVRGDNGESGKLAGRRRNGADGGRTVLDCTGVPPRGLSDGWGQFSCLWMGVLSSIWGGIVKSDFNKTWGV